MFLLLVYFHSYLVLLDLLDHLVILKKSKISKNPTKVLLFSHIRKKSEKYLQNKIDSSI